MSVSLLEDHRMASRTHLVARWIIETFLLVGSAEGLQLGFKFVNSELTDQETIMMEACLSQFMYQHQIQIESDEISANRQGLVLLMLVLAWWTPIYHSGNYSNEMANNLINQAKPMLGDYEILNKIATCLQFTLNTNCGIPLTNEGLVRLRNDLSEWRCENPAEPHSLDSLKRVVGSIVDNASRSLDNTLPPALRFSYSWKLLQDFLSAPVPLVAAGLFELYSKGMLDTTIQSLPSHPCFLQSMKELLQPFAGTYARFCAACTSFLEPPLSWQEQQDTPVSLGDAFSAAVVEMHSQS